VEDVRCGLFHGVPANEDFPTLLSLLKDVIKEKKLTRAKIGVAGLRMLTYDLFAALKEAFPEIRWLDWTRSYNQIRAVKNDLELEVIRRGAEAIDAAFEAAFQAAKPGVTELEVAGALEYMARKRGIDAVFNIFDTRVCSGPRSALKNANPTERKLQRGDAIYIDVSAQYKGYIIDVSTPNCVDADPGKEQLALFETGAQMTEAMVAHAKPGVRAEDMVEISREVAEKNGQGKWFVEYICGHGIGTAQIEIPDFYPGSPDVLAENMTFALEPMIVHPVHGTGCIERMCAVGRDGGRLLSKFPLRPWTRKW
jgi:Xaa-Pro aminopeptidase